MLLSDTVNYEKIPSRTIDINEELIQEQLKEIDKKEERIKLAYIDGIDTLDEYKKNKSMIEKQRKQITKNLSVKKTEQPEENSTSILDNISAVIQILESDSDTSKKGEAIRSICKNIEYDKDNDTISFNLFMIE